MKLFVRIATAAMLGLTAVTANAVSLTIIATPQETSGPFLHNVFHSATSNGGASGTILAWYTLDTTLGSGEANQWDSATGSLEIHVNVYSNASLTTFVGTAVGTSSNLLGASFSAPNAQNGGLIGNISWDFDAATLAFLQGLDPSVTDNLDMAFVDRKYSATTAGGFQPNSRTLIGGLDSVTLWGADSAALISTATSGNNFDTGLTTLGTDLVFQVDPTQTVPLPAPLVLMGSALAALGGARWRQRQRAAR
jgi:hypothetical protein